MCCEPQGSEMPMVKECPVCGEPVDAEGYSGDKCGYSIVQCETCGHAPCDQSC